MTIILCLNVPELMSGGWRNPEVCKKYPGSGFLPHMQAYGEIYSGGEGFKCDPKDIWVVQEEENPVGMALLEKGAKGGVLFCLESPLFAPLFYDRLPELRPKFQRQFLFQGGTDPVYFPSYDAQQLKKPDPWKGRRPRFCYVTSNKHWKVYENVPGWKESRSWQTAVLNQLHDNRYHAIHTLNQIGVVDLYGKGWPLGMTPKAEEIPAGEKIEVMRKYWMGLAIENTSMPGYVTEKLIDCIVAGVLPVYKGAPDIEQFVPRECFLLADRFMWPSEQEALKIIDAGQEFLKSEAGKRFSYQSFAARLLSALLASVPAPKESSGLSDPLPAQP